MMKIKSDFTFSEIIHSRTFCLLCVCLIIIDLSYPLTLSFDSGQYLILSDVIHQETWMQWDPFRGIVFPLLLNVFKGFLGTNQNALLLPMSLAHMALFMICCYFVFQGAQIRNGIAQKVILIFIFLFFAMDPLILGYYHTLLTEFLAATIAGISCYGAYHLYKDNMHPSGSSKATFFWSVFFIVLVPVSWHLKQPYAGAAYFPVIVSSLMIIINRLTKSAVLYGILLNLMIVFTLVVSVITWNVFLQNKNVGNSDRTIDNILVQNLKKNGEMLWNSPFAFGKAMVKRYLAACNFFIYDISKDTMTGFTYDISQESILKEPSLTRAWENEVIAYRMFDSYGRDNLFPMPEAFHPHTTFFAAEYHPPLWLNSVEQSMEIKSNFLFTATYLLLPFILVSFAISWYRKKDSATSLMLILALSSLLNALLNLFVLPIDRYLFWGYPLNLIICVSFIVNFILTGKNNLSKMSQMLRRRTPKHPLVN